MRDNRYLIYSPDAKVCGSCPLASRCLPRTKNSRRITRWEHADVIDRHRQRMVRDNGEVMNLRGSLVEHPLGTLKSWAEIHHFLMRSLARCRGEFNLMTLCYNFKRVLKEIGVGAFVAYCRVRKEAQGIGM
ncbi:MAG: transposase [Rhodobacteraceae bacterium]|nr:transposase [Paracoccaceae bacterium]